jgi:hypothetical protein
MSDKVERITLLNQAAAATHLSTSVTGSLVNIAAYTRLSILTSVIVNSTGAPAMYLDARVNTTDWVQYATLHPDLTTTANTNFVQSSNVPTEVRVRVQPITTTNYMRVKVTAEKYEA